MPELSDVLTRGGSTRLIQGVAAAIVGTRSQYVHIDYAAGRVLNAGMLNGVTVVVGDLVWFLLDDEAGALVIGKQNVSGTHEAGGVAPPAAVTINAVSSATYDAYAVTWTAGTLVQSPTQYASWFYSAGSLSTLAGYSLAAVEVEVTRTSGGPLEFTTHSNVSGSGAYTGGTDRFGAPATPVGVATWVPLPLDWGTELISGAIRGVSIGGGLFSGTYSGTGRIRLTPTT